MSMTLTSGRESRMDGAPALPDPEKEARTRAVAIHLLNQFGEPVTEESLRAIMPEAAQLAERYTSPQFEADAINRNRTRLYDAAVRGYEAGAARAQSRQDARGVVPEDLPADEYGSVSARTVRDANMSPEDQEASLNQFQGLVAGEIQDIRGGRFHGANAQARQYEQDYGLPTNPSATGKTDLDYLREIQQHQGFIRTGRGEMIPVGPAPTPEAIASRRDFDEWSNENPGSERQALYDPQGYETYREGVREGIRERAREDMATYGMGVSDPEARQDLGLAPLTPKQEADREARSRSESRVRQAQRGRFYEERLREDAGELAQGVKPGDIGALERAAFTARTRARKDDLAARRERASMNARLAGGQPTAGSRAGVQNMMQGRDRFDDLIARLGDQRLTNWQRSGIIAGLTPQAATANPTPLGVEAVGAQNAMRQWNSRAMGGMPDDLKNQLGEVQVAGAEAELPVEVAAARERERGRGTLRAESLAGRRLLAKLETDVVGPYATRAEVDEAVRLAVQAGIPQPDAEAYFARRRSWKAYVSGGVAAGEPAEAAPVQLLPGNPGGVGNMGQGSSM